MSRKAKRSASSQDGESSARPEKKQGHATFTQSQTGGGTMGYRGGHSQAPGRGGSRDQGSTAQTVPPCEHCGRPHRGEYRRAIRACFRCGEHGHLLRDCPYPRRETGTAASEPTVQHPRTGGLGTTVSRGRGRGQAASSAPHAGRPGSQS